MNLAEIDIRQGDVFCTENVAFLGQVINWIQKLSSKDDSSIYSHAGIITSMDGDTFEALSTIRADHLSNRKGQKILIARPLFKDVVGGMIHPIEKKVAIVRLQDEYRGNWYPWWRLILHAIPLASRYISAQGKFLVCSELVAKYLYLIGARPEPYTGISPDDLADEFVRWSNYEVVFEGTL